MAADALRSMTISQFSSVLVSEQTIGRSILACHHKQPLLVLAAVAYQKPGRVGGHFMFGQVSDGQANQALLFL